MRNNMHILKNVFMTYTTLKSFTYMYVHLKLKSCVYYKHIQKVCIEITNIE